MLSERDMERILAVLDRKRYEERDIEFRKYDRPDGVGVAIMKAREGGAEFAVMAPGRTFKPGTVAATGSKTGRPGELLLHTAVGQSGQSGFPPIIGGAELPAPLPVISWETLTPNPVVFNSEAPGAFVDVALVGAGFDETLQLTIVNQDNAGQFSITNIVVSDDHINATFRVVLNSTGIGGGDLRFEQYPQIIAPSGGLVGFAQYVEI